MARIEDLIDEIPDPALRDQIAREVKALKSTKRFGLVYEDHVPETVSLYGLPVRPGTVVQKRTAPDDPGRYEVVGVDGDTATIVPVGQDEPKEEVSARDLLTVKRFEEPIYPGLTPVGEVRRGPADKPAHTVISGENFHALQLLAYTHAGKVDVIYIDPPYNTGARDWKYNNRFVDSNDSYRHSKWLAMMEKRLRLAEKLLKPDGVLIVTIDEHELHHLGLLLEDLFSESYRQIVTIVINPSGASGDGLSRVEEYAVFVFPPGREPDRVLDDMLSDTSTRRGAAIRWESLMRGGQSWYRDTRPNLCYGIVVDEAGRIAGTTEPLAGTEDSRDLGTSERPILWPLRSDGRLGIWRAGAAALQALARDGLAYVSSLDREARRGTVRYVLSGTSRAIAEGVIVVKGREPDGRAVLERVAPKETLAKTVWRRSAHVAGGSGGSHLLTALLGTRGAFSYPKSLYSTADALACVASTREDAIILDFFAGSGTTLHSVVMLNAQAGGNRQCILVTNNDVSDSEAKVLNDRGLFPGDPDYEAQGIFESVTRPRVEAAINGTRPDGLPVEGKYLEQYLPDHDYSDGFEENVAFFRMDYLEPDLVELGRQYEVIAPLLWMTAGSVGHWEPWDGTSPWSAPEDSTYAVLFDESQSAAFGAYVESRAEEITHVWIVTDSHSAFLDLREELPAHVIAGQLYRDYLRNFVVNAPGAVR